MGLLLLLLVIPIGIGAFAACVSTGLWNLATSIRRSGEDRRHDIARGLTKLAAAVLIGAVPWVAIPVAEAGTGWVDKDHDGMLDGFVNGSYDWVDINGGRWATVVAVLIAMTIVALLVALAAMHRLTAASREARAVAVDD